MRRIKPAANQVSLIGEVHDHQSGIVPRIVSSPSGASVVVTRIPEGTDHLTRQKALDEAVRLARTIKVTVKGYRRRPTITEGDYE